MAQQAPAWRICVCKLELGNEIENLTQDQLKQLKKIIEEEYHEG
jgi:hypothetical protein